MTSTSIWRSSKASRTALGGFALLLIFALIGVAVSRREVRAEARRVSIDILPGQASKTIDMSNPAPLPVAIYSSPEFDASSIDPATVSIAGASITKRKNGNLRAYPKDVNGDGLNDLLVYVAKESLQIGEEATDASLIAATFDGKPVTGSEVAFAARKAVATGQAGGPVGADEVNGIVFTGGAITINDSAAPPTQATPYPSNITVSGLTGLVGVVGVTINGFSHAFPDDVDILLKGPTGANAIIMSDVGGSIAVSNLTLNLDDNAAASLPDAGPLASGTFKPTNVGAGDTFPTQAPSGGSVLSVFKGTAPNGTWSLYVVDDANGQAGSITSWSLNIATVTQTCNSAAITITAGGIAGTYPSDITVAGLTANVAHATVTITGFQHNFATDVDMCLQGPTGATAVIWSDVGPNGPSATVNIVLDDFAASSLPVGAALASGTFKPTNADANPEVFPAPGPGSVNIAQVALSTFNGLTGNGTWHLWIKDDTSGDGGSISGGWCLTIAQGPTLARFSSASATSGDDGQVSLTWQTGFEVDNLGFNVYRDEGGQRTRVNKRLIAGSAFVAGQGTALTAGRTYKWRDKVSPGGSGDYWIEAISVDGSHTWHGPVKSVYSPGSADAAVKPIGDPQAGTASANSVWLEKSTRELKAKVEEAERRLASSQKQMSPAEYNTLVRDLETNRKLYADFLQKTIQTKLQEQAQSPALSDLGSKNGGSNPLNTASVSVQPAASGQTAFKIGVKQTGYYRVNQADLVMAGLSRDIDPRNLRLFEDGLERAITVQGGQGGRLNPGDWIEFYGTAVDNAYTDTHVYQLVAGSQPGLRIKRAKDKAGTPGAESFPFTAELRERNLYFPGAKNGQEKFFGAVVTKQPVDSILRLQHVSAGAGSEATVEVALQGVSGGSHNVRVRLNDADLGAVSFEGKNPGAARFSVPQSSLKEGENSIELAASGGDSDVCLVSAIRVTYQHAYAADDNALQFTASGKTRVSVTGFSGSSIRVVDVSDAEKEGVREVAATVHQDGDGYTVSVNVPGAGNRTLLAVAGDRIQSPAEISADFPSSWRTKNNKADLVIITRGDFISALQPLKIQRESQGYRVAIVDVGDVYDEFGNGNKTPQAIKDFFAYATSKWKGKPRFALLAGDASFDPKNYLGDGSWDLIPTKLIETQFMETASDDFFVDFKGNGLPEMAIGRLPARSASEMSALVAKIVGYDSASPAGSLLLVADTGDGFDFANASASLRAFIPGNLSTLEIDRGVTDDSTARSLLLAYLNQGQSVINYLGHGSVDLWRNNLLTNDDAGSLANNGRLSLFVSMTCMNGYFQDAAIDSLGEAMLKSKNGGAVAAWASSGMCDPGEQGSMNREFYRLLFGGGTLTVGEAAMKAKSAVSDMDIRRTWILLGDPTTRLR